MANMHNSPAEMKWLHRKADAVDVSQRTNSMRIVARDKRATGATKQYAVFNTDSAYWEYTKSLNPDQRRMYCLNNSADFKLVYSKLYMDAEWICRDGKEDKQSKLRMTTISMHVQAYMVAMFTQLQRPDAAERTANMDWVLHKRSRETEKGFKNSWHLYLPVYFEDNTKHCLGIMMRRAIEYTEQQIGDNLYCVAANGDRSMVIDLSVYNKSRLMRAPWSLKAGEDSNGEHGKLRRSTFMDMLSCHHFPAGKPVAFFSVEDVIEVTGTKKRQRTIVGAVMKVKRQRRDCHNQELDLTSVITSMLEQQDITGVEVAQSACPDVYKLTHPERWCPFSCDGVVTHTNNNAFVKFYADQSGKCVLHCHSKRCSGKQLVIGWYTDGVPSGRPMFARQTTPADAYVPPKGKTLWRYNCKATQQKYEIKRGLGFDCHIPGYVQPFVISPDVQVYMVLAACGTGKSRALRGLLAASKAEADAANRMCRVLFVCPRKAFGRSQMGEMKQVFVDIVFYGEKGKDGFVENNDHFICQYESLRRLDLEENDPYDIVVLDEVRALMSQVTSVTTNGKHMYHNFEMLKYLVKGAKVVVGLSADLEVDPSVPRFINTLFPDTTKVRVDRYYVPRMKRCMTVMTDNALWMAQLADGIQCGGKVAIFCKEKRKVHYWTEWCTLRMKEYGATRGVDGDFGVVHYTGDSTDQQMKDFENPPQAWEKKRVIIFNGCLTVGNSINMPFQQVFADLRGFGPVPLDTLQALLRFRDVKKERIPCLTSGNLFNAPHWDFASRRKTREEAFIARVRYRKKDHRALEMDGKWTIVEGVNGRRRNKFTLGLLANLCLDVQTADSASFTRSMYDLCSRPGLSVELIVPDGVTPANAVDADWDNDDGPGDEKEDEKDDITRKVKETQEEENNRLLEALKKPKTDAERLVFKKSIMDITNTAECGGFHRKLMDYMNTLDQAFGNEASRACVLQSVSTMIRCLSPKHIAKMWAMALLLQSKGRPASNRVVITATMRSSGAMLFPGSVTEVDVIDSYNTTRKLMKTLGVEYFGLFPTIDSHGEGTATIEKEQLQKQYAHIVDQVRKAAIPFNKSATKRWYTRFQIKQLDPSKTANAKLCASAISHLRYILRRFGIIVLKVGQFDSIIKIGLDHKLQKIVQTSTMNVA